LKQLANFGENESGRTEALTGHDDLLFAFGIALCSRRENYFAPTTAAAPTRNHFDPSVFGFPMYANTVGESLAAHWKKLQRPAKGSPLEERSYLEL
jgi:hypothetical protein